MAKLNQDLLMQLETKMGDSKVLKLKVNGKTIDITVEKKFLNTKIEALIQELLELNQYATDNEITGFNITTMLFVMIFKTFTDIPYIEKGTIEEKLENYIRTTNVLKDLECEDGISVFDKLVNEFELEQIEKINKKMKLFADNINTYITEQNKEEVEDGNV